MLNIDDFIKLILAISVAFAIVIVAWQLAKLLGAVAANLQDLRRVTQNLGKVSDMAVEDYSRVRGFVANFKNMFSGVTGVLETVNNLKGKIPQFGKVRTPKTGEDNEE